MSNKLKQIPVGIDDFKEIIEKNTFYIDKTILNQKNNRKRK